MDVAAVVRIILLSLLLVSCSDMYRYPCQNPDNWEHKVCKKPYCSANGTCPEDLTPYEKDRTTNANKGTASNLAQAPKDCK
jgi:hypothetical protein